MLFEILISLYSLSTVGKRIAGNLEMQQQHGSQSVRNLMIILQSRKYYPPLPARSGETDTAEIEGEEEHELEEIASTVVEPYNE